MTDNIHDMSRAIGSLEASVKNLMDMWGRNDRDATEGRRALYGKFDELKTEVTKLAGRVDALVGDVSVLKPSVENFKSLRDEGIGSKKTIAIVWAALIGIIGATAAGVVELIHIFWPRH